MNGTSIRARSPSAKRPGAEGQEAERGFTLIELMVVTVIVAILAGIAGVQFRGVQVKAHLTSVVADGRILFHGLEE